MRKKILVTTILSLAAAMISLTAAPPASAVEKVPQADIDHIRAELTKYDVPESAQSRLLREYAMGERWDSATGAEPVATKTTRANGVERTIYRYADGSVNVGEVEIPSADTTEGVSPHSISGCQAYPKAGARAWRNCKIAWNGVTWEVTFTAAYTIWLGPLYGCYIDSIGGLTHGGAGSWSNGRLEFITRSANGYSGRCVAQGTWQQSSPIHSSTVGVRLTVSFEYNGGRSSRIG
jgi:hypothetical protein